MPTGVESPGLIFKMKKIFYTWKEFDNDIKYISKLILKDKDIKCVIGIPRGGLIPAVTLAHLLEIPFFLNLEDAYNEFEQNEILIVDDIADSGNTFSNIKLINNYKTVSLFVKEKTKFVPTYYSKICEKKLWIIFPWEKNNSKTKRDGTYGNE